jgi:YhgE/Pip-like protein
MKNAFKAYLKMPQTKLALIVALAAQIIFIICWMTAYHGTNDRTNHLKIAIINEDGDFGKTIVDNLKSTLPFEITTPTKDEAMKDLELRKVHLMVTIPAKFGESVKTPGSKATIQYTLNQSNPQQTKSIMESVENKLTNSLNHNAALQGTQVMLEQMKLPADKAKSTAEGILNKVEAKATNLYTVNGMHNQMATMMLVLASYVGAMLYAMNLCQVSFDLGAAVSKMNHFTIRAIVTIVSAAIVSLAGCIMIIVLDGQMEAGFASFWGFHFLTMLTFMFFAQTFLLIIGPPGMLINMAVLSLQLVTSGTTVPREVLSDFYQSFGNYLPATYSVEGFMNLGIGGIETQHDVNLLFVILAASVAVCLVMTLVKKQSPATDTAMQQAKEVLAN